MKERILKWGVLFFLVAVLVVAGVYPVTSQAAAKKTTYNVVLQNGSAGVNLISINNGAASPSVNEAQYSFKMVVEEKAKTEKLKTGPASYYPVTILAKSFKCPSSETPMVGGGMAIIASYMKKDATGKLYLSGGDVDVSQVQGEKKITTKIGDGKADPAYSLIIPNFAFFTDTKYKDNGKLFLSAPSTVTLTTGTNYIVVKGSKSGLENKALSDNDTTKLLPKPLMGAPLNLDAGTGTLVGTGGTMNIKNKDLGELDFLSGTVFVMKITK